MKKFLTITGIVIALIIVSIALIPTPKDGPSTNSNDTTVTTTESSVQTEEKNSALTYVYDDEVDGPSDCTSLEKYDTEKEACYYTCTDQADCDRVDGLINKELDGWEQDYKTFSANIKDADADKTAVSDEKSKDVNSTQYLVKPGEKIALASGKDLPAYHKYWEIFAAISPDELTDKFVSNFLVYRDEKDDLEAFVLYQDSDQKWQLAINESVFGEETSKEQIFTLIHEFSHLLTLNAEQVNPNTSEKSCPRYYDDGCAIQNSYINTFVNKFWTPKMIASAKKDSEKLATDYPDNFVTEYAATNPSEDIAESFASYVFGTDSNSNESNETAITAEKLSFFADYAELVSLRSSIRLSLNKLTAP
jgi:hypothetical protein